MTMLVTSTACTTDGAIGDQPDFLPMFFWSLGCEARQD